MAYEVRRTLAGPALVLLAFGCSETAPATSGASSTSAAGTAGSSASSSSGASVGSGGSSVATTASSSSSSSGSAGSSTGAGGSGGSGGASGSSGGAAPDASATADAQGGASGTGGSGNSDAGSDAASGSDASSTGCPGNGKICWDFETGRTPTGWAPVTNQGTGSIAVDNTRAHAGMYALHVKGSGSNPMHSLGQTLPANFGGTMWGRAFMYLTPQGPGDHGATFKARYADATDTTFGPDKLDWYEVGLGHGTYETIWHKPQPPSGLPEWEMISNTPVTLNKWFCEEWLFDGVNGTNPEAAEPKMWIDGTELAFPDKHIYPGGSPKPPFTKATNFILIEVGLIMYHPLSAATDLWIDDLVLGAQRIGCN